jgi:hypothetical protein
VSTRHLAHLVAVVGIGAAALSACGDTKITLALPTTVGATTVASATPPAAGTTAAAAAAATTNAPAAAATTKAPAAATTTKAPAAATTTEPPITVDPNKPGNAYIQTPIEGLVPDCRSGDNPSCTELDERIARLSEPDYLGPEASTFLCYFFYQWQSQPDAFALGYMTKVWNQMGPGPGGVTAGLATLVNDPDNAAANDSVKGYIRGICPNGD